MSTEVQLAPKSIKLARKTLDVGALEAFLVHADVKTMSDPQKTEFLRQLCNLTSLNPLTRPFEFLKFQGEMKLYANKGCAEQLRDIHGISVKIASRESVEIPTGTGDQKQQIFIVTAQAQNSEGRWDASICAVCLLGLKGEALANAVMKAETKAKRRVTLSICGLNMIDDSEVESIPGAIRVESKEIPATIPPIDPPKAPEVIKPIAAAPVTSKESIPVCLPREASDAQMTHLFQAAKMIGLNNWGELKVLSPSTAQLATHKKLTLDQYHDLCNALDDFAQDMNR